MADQPASIPDIPRRMVALVATVLIHLPVLFVGHSRERPQFDAGAMQLRIIWEQESAPLADFAIPVVERRQADRAAALASSPNEAETPRAAPAPRIDWEIEGAIAAQAAIESIIRDEAYRPLGPYEKAHQIVEPAPPPSIFETPKRRRGDVAENALGLASVWVNENCYVQLEKPVSRRPSDIDGGVNPVVCVVPVGKREPRGDLFDHLKKEYPDPHPAAPTPSPDSEHGGASSQSQ